LGPGHGSMLETSSDNPAKSRQLAVNNNKLFCESIGI
jgi:hypothetical protein